MSVARPRHRLFVETELAAMVPVPLSAGQVHYLGTVVRCTLGDTVALFNGRDGEWLARIAELGKGRGRVEPLQQLRPQTADLDLWLCFAPIKGPRLDGIAEKASELGVSLLQPVLTRRTVVTRVNVARLRANAIEAAEQCERLSVPEVRAPVALEDLLAGWPAGRRLMLCDESRTAPPAADLLAASREDVGPWAVLVGPEGGFTASELAAARAVPGAVAVSLGPRVLRADTAVVAALAVWQAVKGDWAAVKPDSRCLGYLQR